MTKSKFKVSHVMTRTKRTDGTGEGGRVSRQVFTSKTVCCCYLVTSKHTSTQADKHTHTQRHTRTRYHALLLGSTAARRESQSRESREQRETLFDAVATNKLSSVPRPSVRPFVPLWACQRGDFAMRFMRIPLPTSRLGGLGPRSERERNEEDKSSRPSRPIRPGPGHQKKRDAEACCCCLPEPPK